MGFSTFTLECLLLLSMLSSCLGSHILEALWVYTRRYAMAQSQVNAKILCL